MASFLRLSCIKVMGFFILALIKIYPVNECDKRIKQILNEADFNRDGSISFSEFTALSLKHDRTLSEEVLRKAFNLFDLVI